MFNLLRQINLNYGEVMMSTSLMFGFGDVVMLLSPARRSLFVSLSYICSFFVDYCVCQ